MDVVAPEEEGAREVPQFRDEVGGRVGLQGFHHGLGSAHRLRDVLGEIADGDARAEDDLSLVARIHRGQDAEQGRLAGAVAAHHDELLARLHEEVEAG